MERSYKTVDRMIQLWVMTRERLLSGDLIQLSPKADELERPYLPSTPLHSPELYWDSQFVRAS